MIVLLVLALAVGAWAVMLAVGGADPQDAWERRLRRRYRGYHRAQPAARPLARSAVRPLTRTTARRPRL